MKIAKTCKVILQVLFTGLLIGICSAKMRICGKMLDIYMKKAAYSGFSFGASFCLLAVGAHIPIMYIGFKDCIEIMNCQ